MVDDKEVGRSNLITINSVVIIQRGNYFKNCKVLSGRPQKLGKWGENQITLDLDGAVGHPYGSVFRLNKKEKKIHVLERVEDLVESCDIAEVFQNTECGYDNRSITDDGTSQKLSKEEIKQMVNSGLPSDEVVQAIASNSSTFTSKTKYSQEKYISKKQKKYECYVTLLRPTIRIVSKMYFMQDSQKVANLRVDILSQMLCYADVSPEKPCLVYESGTLGLVTASVLSRVGSGGKIVQVYSGDWPRKDAIEMMDFSKEELESLSYIGANNLPDFSDPASMEELDECLLKEKEYQVEKLKRDSGETENSNIRMTKPKSLKFTRTRVEDILLSCKVLSEGVASLLIASKQCTSSITLALLDYLRPGHNLAIYSPNKQFLMSMFPLLKAKNCVNVQLTETWMREFQVLPERTHPDIIMSGLGGYLLTGAKVSDCSS